MWLVSMCGVAPSFQQVVRPAAAICWHNEDPTDARGKDYKGAKGGKNRWSGWLRWLLTTVQLFEMQNLHISQRNMPDTSTGRTLITVCQSARLHAQLQSSYNYSWTWPFNSITVLVPVYMHRRKIKLLIKDCMMLWEKKVQYILLLLTLLINQDPLDYSKNDQSNSYNCIVLTFDGGTLQLMIWQL